MNSHWIERLEAALRGEPADDVELVPKHAPPLLDSFGRSVMLAPFLAAFFWAAVLFYVRKSGPLDPVLLLLRLLALALSARALVLLWLFAGRVRIALERGSYQLALHAE